MPKPDVHFLVCQTDRPAGHPRGCCTERNGMEPLVALMTRLQETENFDRVKVSIVKSCLGPCSEGPVVVVYPDNVWYGKMTGEKAKEVFDSHVNEGKAVASYMIPEGVL